MATGDISLECRKCMGTGISNKSDGLGHAIEEDPCSACGGIGYRKTGKNDLTDIIEKLDYIHGKVTAIWNKVK